jgi:hypothetical protein
MYEVAVLEAGSAGALKKWLDDHGYRYPDGMEKPCNEYVKHQWCFVAIKTKVGPKSGVDPKPGQRRVDPKLPAGATFDGNVQAMGFRFRSDRLVVPMRLSAFNAGRLHNIVYLLTDGPKRVRSIPEEYVVRQIPGEDLIRNTTDPLPLRIVGGTEDQLEKWQRDALPKQRDPAPHNGSARELFAADMEAISHDRLANQYEEQEKVLLSIGERLGLRGAEIDKLHGAALADDRKKESDAALAKLKGMTLTVIDGDFPREVIARQNLAFDDYRMPARRNRAEVYDAIQKGPTGKKEGIRKLGALSAPGESTESAKVIAAATSVGPAAAGVLAVTILGFVLGRRRPARRRA